MLGINSTDTNNNNYVIKQGNNCSLGQLLLPFQRTSFYDYIYSSKIIFLSKKEIKLEIKLIKYDREVMKLRWIIDIFAIIRQKQKGRKPGE